MMYKTTVVVVIFIIFLKEFQAESISEVIADLTSKIVGLKTNINLAIQDGRNAIRQIYRINGETITVAEMTIQDQLEQLDDLITQAEQEAQENNVDIKNCITQVTGVLSKINLDSFEKCKNDFDLRLLAQELEVLGILKRNLSQTINICLLKYPLDLVSLRNCVEEDLKTTRVKLENVRNHIERVIEEAEDESSTCVNDVVKNLDKIISDVAHDLKNCLLKIF